MHCPYTFSAHLFTHLIYLYTTSSLVHLFLATRHFLCVFSHLSSVAAPPMLRRCDSVARHASLSLMWRPRPCCFVCQTVRLVSDRSSPIAFPSPYRADGGARPPHQRHPSPAATHDLFARSRRLHHKRTGGKPLGYAAQATGPALAPPPPPAFISTPIKRMPRTSTPRIATTALVGCGSCGSVCHAIAGCATTYSAPCC